MPIFLVQGRRWRRMVAHGAGLIFLVSDATAADVTTAAPNPDPLPVFVMPRHVYRSPSLMTTDAQPASGASEVEIRKPPSIEQPDNWACRTSNVLTRSSVNRNNEGKSISDLEPLMPKC